MTVFLATHWLLCNCLCALNKHIIQVNEGATYQSYLLTIDICIHDLKEYESDQSWSEIRNRPEIDSRTDVGKLLANQNRL